MSSYSDKLKDAVSGILAGIKAKRTRKAVNFDLETQAILSVTGFKSTAPAYSMIREFMEAHGFKHRQYSGYVSINPMSVAEVCRVLDDLSHALPWLPRCYQRCDITTLLGPSYDYLAMSSFGQTDLADHIGFNETGRSQERNETWDNPEIDPDDLTPEEQSLTLDAIAELYQSYCDDFNRPNDGRCPGTDRGDARLRPPPCPPQQNIRASRALRTLPSVSALFLCASMSASNLEKSASLAQCW